jgi:hypothetical protein
MSHARFAQLALCTHRCSPSSDCARMAIRLPLLWRRFWQVFERYKHVANTSLHKHRVGKILGGVQIMLDFCAILQACEHLAVNPRRPNNFALVSLALENMKVPMLINVRKFCKPSELCRTIPSVVRLEGLNYCKGLFREARKMSFTEEFEELVPCSGNGRITYRRPGTEQREFATILPSFRQRCSRIST